MWIHRAILIVIAFASSHAEIRAQGNAPSGAPSTGAPAANEDPAIPQESDTADAKLPIPDEAAQNESSSLVKDVYKTDYDNAKTNAQKRDLAKKLLQEGIQTEGDPAGRFVLMRIARDMATQAGDVAVAIQAIDQIGKTYDVDPLDMKVKVLTTMSKSALTVAAQKELIEAIEHVTDAAVEVDSHLIAQQLSGLALTVARTAKDPSLLKRVVARSKECDQNAAAFAEAQKALKVLDENPTDPEANLVVGKFRCFNRMDWENGLPLLALGSDADLKSLADRESTPPTKASDQTALGDGWWAIAEKESGIAKTSVRSRASHWYQQALPGLAGLAKAKVAKRLSEITPANVKKRVVAVPKDPKDIDALKEVNPARHSIGGKWLKNGENEIVGLPPDIAEPRNARIVLPASVKGDYELEIDFTRIGGDIVSVVLPVGKGRCQLWMDLEGTGGFSTVAHADPRFNNTKTPLKLETNRRYTLVVHVATTKAGEGTIAALLNGSRVLEWKGKAADLAVSPIWTWPNEMSFGVGAHGHISFHSVRIRPVSSRREGDQARTDKANEPYPVAVYRHIVPGRGEPKLTFMSNGKILGGNTTWRIDGKLLILDWTNGNDARWHDELRISDDGATYNGKNQSGVAIRGEAVELSKDWRKLLGIDR